jgi:hypothetical protein
MTEWPDETEGRDPECPGFVRSLSVVSTPVPSTDHIVKEPHMKRIIVALVLALSIVSVVGCGGGATTTSTKK